MVKFVSFQPTHSGGRSNQYPDGDARSQRLLDLFWKKQAYAAYASVDRLVLPLDNNSCYGRAMGIYRELARHAPSRVLRHLGRSIKGNFESGGLRGEVRLWAALPLYALGGLTSRIGPTRRSCPCCGWSGSHFIPYIDVGYVTFDSVCPACQSHGRHRGHIAFYTQNLNNLSGKLLYVAPEKNIDFFRGQPGLEIETSEYAPEKDSDHHFDLTAIDAADETWDVIVCHRVIEHVADDRQAMRELFRVLKPGGTAILSVPITFDLDETIEYGRPNPLETDHYYRYGRDFRTRIPPEFAVEEHHFSEMFTPEAFASMSLLDDVLFVCRKALS